MKRLLVLIALLGFAGVAFANSASSKQAGYATTKIHYNELPFQPVDGLSYKGVRYSFTIGGVPSTDANYNSGGPGCGYPNTDPSIVCDPSLEGNSDGRLTLNFKTPTRVLRFGVAVNCYGCFLSDTVHVELARFVGGPLVPTDFDTFPPYCCWDGFSEFHFNYEGGAVITRLSITFPGWLGSRFAFDNLEYSALSLVKTHSAAGPALFAPGGKSWAH